METQQDSSFYHFREQALHKQRIQNHTFYLAILKCFIFYAQVIYHMHREDNSGYCISKRESEAIQIPIKMNCMGCTSLGNF